ncbi:MAG: CRISPR-associated endonuclease Cas2, partial [Candidatus Thorarchaeota archaeon]|nr:CRISPR-associated endonuclease Cas2 [Candidatus Thorarchaeota archaeon]
MYVIIVYDIEVERIDKIRKILKRYLFWIQNSVFEGELSESGFKRLVAEVKEKMDKSYDSIIIFKMNSSKSLKKQI